MRSFVWDADEFTNVSRIRWDSDVPFELRICARKRFVALVCWARDLVVCGPLRGRVGAGRSVCAVRGLRDDRQWGRDRLQRRFHGSPKGVSPGNFHSLFGRVTAFSKLLVESPPSVWGSVAVSRRLHCVVRNKQRHSAKWCDTPWRFGNTECGPNWLLWWESGSS